MIQPSDGGINLKYAIDLVLNFNETIQLDLVWKYRNKKNERVLLLGGNTQKLLGTLCN